MAVSRENPETLCLYPVQIDTAHLSPEAPKNNGIFGSSCSVNRTAVVELIDYAVLLEGPRQNECDKTADLGAPQQAFALRDPASRALVGAALSSIAKAIGGA